MRVPFDRIMAANTDKGLCNVDKAVFHYFNVNGVRAQKARLDRIIDKNIENGKLGLGWYLAYGSGSDSQYSVNKLHTLTLKQRVAGATLYAVLESIRFSIRKAEQALTEKGIQL